MSWATVAGAAVSVVGGYIGSHSEGSSGSNPAGAADPFASQRPQYQQQLQQLMVPGQNFTPQDPSYQFRLNQGLEGVNRGAAASGLLNSGNRLSALMDYGQNTASTEYSNQFDRLATLSGATIGSPAAAAQLQQGQNAASSAFWQQTGNQLVGAAQNWWNSPGETSSTSSASYGSGTLF